MKKITLLLIVAFISTLAFSQNNNDKKVQYFVDAATKEFSLDAAKSKELLATRGSYIKSMQDLSKQVKAGEVTEEAKKTKSNEINAEFKKSMEALTGKTPKELEPFYVRMREELKQL